MTYVIFYNQETYLKPNNLLFTVLATKVNKTKLIVLMGIKIAAINGDKVPVTANDNPIKLYNNDMMKLQIMMCDARCEYAMSL